MLRSLVFLAAILPSTLAKTGCGEALKECDGYQQRRPVCGSDDRTYHTRCRFLRAQCADPNLVLINVGPCPDPPSCWESTALERAGRKGFHFYSVKCLPDGSFAPVQCHEEFCWCSTRAGLPIPNTTLRRQRPKCHRDKEPFSTGKRKKFKNRWGNRRHKGKVCGKVEKVRFINNLVRKFNKELCRQEEGKERPPHCDYVIQESDDSYKKGVEWKFSTLDTNVDKNLTSNEYHEFQKLVKKAVSPQKCSRMFINICDENKDGVITSEEWSSCLVKRPVVKKNKPKKKKAPPDGDFGGDLIGSTGKIVIRDGVAVLNGHVNPLDESEALPERKDEPEGSDCLTDRKSVEEEQATVSFELFLPECTADGRYQKVQCYRSTGYCWCVNEDTGKPIPGTSRKDLNPNCDALQLPLKPMKGCPEHKKKIFLVELKDYFKKQNQSGTVMENVENNEEFAVMNFQVLDKNKNKFLEKKEMRPLRMLLATFSQPVKRCAKKFPKYCDVNHDRKISLTEWVNCMDSERSGVGMTVSPSQRKGPNPLETILKPDDDEDDGD